MKFLFLVVTVLALICCYFCPPVASDSETNGETTERSTDSFTSTLIDWLFRAYTSSYDGDNQREHGAEKLAVTSANSMKLANSSRTERQIVLSPAQLLLLQQQQQQQAIATAQLQQQLVRNKYDQLELEDSSEEDDDIEPNDFWDASPIRRRIIPGVGIFRSDVPETTTEEQLRVTKTEDTSSEETDETDCTCHPMSTTMSMGSSSSSSTESTTSGSGSNSTESTTSGSGSTQSSTSSGTSSTESSTSSGSSSTQASSSGTGSTSATSSGTGSTSMTSSGSSTSSGSPETTTPESSTSETTTMGPKKPPYKATLDCRCGTQTTKDIKVGTIDVQSNLYPWIVSIKSKTAHLCTGNIINSKFVLTSAACLNGLTASDIEIQGTLTSTNRTKYTVDKIHMHPAYQQGSKGNNIALLEINEFFRPTKSVKFICLPIGDKMQPESGITVTLAKNTHTKKLTLVQENVPEIKQNRCKALLKREKADMPQNTFCTAPPRRECQGDTGGSFITHGQGYSFIIKGLISYKSGCKRKAQPTLHTMISKYVNWILYKTQKASYCKEPSYASELSKHTGIEYR